MTARIYIVQKGKKFLLGYDQNVFGIWPIDNQDGLPIASFPRSQEFWNQAVEVFEQFESGASPAPVAPTGYHIPYPPQPLSGGSGPDRIGYGGFYGVPPTQGQGNYNYVLAAKAKRFATISAIAGGVSLLLNIFFIPSCIALIYGYSALKTSKQVSENIGVEQSVKTLAIIGIVLAVLGLAIYLYGIIVVSHSLGHVHL